MSLTGFLKELGYPKEIIENSEVLLLFESMIKGFEGAVNEETNNLMRKYSLSYGEARCIAINRVKNCVNNRLRDDNL